MNVALRHKHPSDIQPVLSDVSTYLFQGLFNSHFHSFNGHIKQVFTCIIKNGFPAIKKEDVMKS